MPPTEPKRVAYLFGAGATHAELTNLYPDLTEEELKESGLLINYVSARVIEKARRNPEYLKGVEMVSATSGSLNIELLISLLESSKIHKWAKKTSYLKELVQKDIEAVLTRPRTRRFYLHRALFELHGHPITRLQEKLTGLISLNYDDVLDEAYRKHDGPPNYCFSMESGVSRLEPIPLLKLHGSFNWRNQKIRGRTRTIEIIPLGVSKNYLHAPYNFIWNRALEILIECDTLRVIGCSLSPNDVHLIDLLFKAHLERPDPFDIEIISHEDTGQQIRNNYGFLPGIKPLLEIEGTLIRDRAPDNPFKAWLKYKSLATIKDRTKRTQFLKMVIR